MYYLLGQNPNESDNDGPSSYCSTMNNIKDIFGSGWTYRMLLLMKEIVEGTSTYKEISCWRKILSNRTGTTQG